MGLRAPCQNSVPGGLLWDRAGLEPSSDVRFLWSWQLGFSLQIRKDALRALNVAYTASTQRSTGFPLDGVVRTLLFQDCDEATDFLNYHGLGVADG